MTEPRMLRVWTMLRGEIDPPEVVEMPVKLPPRRVDNPAGTMRERQRQAGETK